MMGSFDSKVGKMKKIRVGLIGFGTVGKSVYRALSENTVEVNSRLGNKAVIELTSICIRNQEKYDSFCDSKIKIFRDPFALLDSDTDIIIEVIGGTNIAKKIITKALGKKQHVVTANKELIALHGGELFGLAELNSVSLSFEAAVAGGIPIIKALREGLGGNKIKLVAGIINGTTNYILTQMQKDRSDFQTSLKVAVEKGFAEQDPSFDIDGIDAAHKLTIISAISYGVDFQFKKVFCQGISKIELRDIDFARKFGYCVKLLGIAKLTDIGIELRVHPALVPERSLMSKIDGAMNGILVVGDIVGSTIYYGAGAGGDPTASAVISDVLDIAQKKALGVKSFPTFKKQARANGVHKILDVEQIKTAYYLRLSVDDQVGVMSDVTKILAFFKISIEAMFQGEPFSAQDAVDVVIITHKTTEGSIRRALFDINKLSHVKGDVRLIRIESLDLK